ncbi:MAG: hypothetical protein ACI4LP_06915 [Anaerovoracaceae bacterium]
MEKVKKNGSIKKILALTLAFMMVFTGLGIGQWGLEDAWADATCYTVNDVIGITLDDLDGGTPQTPEQLPVKGDGTLVGKYNDKNLYCIELEKKYTSIIIKNTNVSYYKPGSTAVSQFRNYSGCADIDATTGSSVSSQGGHSVLGKEISTESEYGISAQDFFKKSYDKIIWNTGISKGKDEPYLMFTLLTNSRGAVSSLDAYLIVKLGEGEESKPIETESLSAIVSESEGLEPNKFYSFADRYNGKTTVTDLVSSLKNNDTIKADSDTLKVLNTDCTSFWSIYKAAMGRVDTIYPLENGIRTLKDGVTQKQVDAAAALLEAAIANLIPTTQINPTELYELIQNQSGKDESTFTTASWTEFSKIMEKAQTVLQSLYYQKDDNLPEGKSIGDATEINNVLNGETVNAVADAVEYLNAVKRGGVLVSKNTYNANLQKAQWDWDCMATLLNQLNQRNYSEGDFTAGTWTAYKKALDTAQNFYNTHTRPVEVEDGSNYAEIFALCGDPVRNNGLGIYETLLTAYGALTPETDTVTISLYVEDSCLGSAVDNTETGSRSWTHNEALTVPAGTTLQDVIKNISFGTYSLSNARIMMVNGIAMHPNRLENVGLGGLNYVLKDGDKAVCARIPVPGSQNSSGVGSQNDESAKWVKLVKLVRFADESGQPVSTMEVEAGAALQVKAQWNLTHLSVYDGKFNPASGYNVYVSDVSETADNLGPAATDTGVATASDGSFSLSFLEEGYYAVRLVHKVSASTYQPSQIAASSAIIVHVTKSTNLDGVKDGYKAELKALYEKFSNTDFTEENWKTFKDAYQDGLSAIEEAATVLAADSAQKEAAAAMDAVERIDHEGILAAFRTKLAAVYSDTSKLDQRDVDAVTAAKESYEALSDYQKGLLTVAEDKKITAAIAALDGLENVEPETYTLTIGEVDPAGTGLTVTIYDPYKMEYIYRDSAEGTFNIQRGWQITLNGSAWLRSNLTVLQALSAPGAYIAELKGCSSYMEDTEAKISFASLNQINPDYASMPSQYGPHDFSYEATVPNKIEWWENGVYHWEIDPDNPTKVEYRERGFYGAVLYAGTSDIIISLSLKTDDVDPYEEVRTAALQDIDAAVTALTRTDYTDEGWTKIITAQNEGISSVNKAETAEAIEAAKSAALAAIAAQADDSANKKNYGQTEEQKDILGYVTVSVENNTFTTPTGGDTPAFTGYLVAPTRIGFTSEDSMMTLVLKALSDQGYTWEGTGHTDGNPSGYTITYLSEISKNGKSLGEFDGCNQSGWMGLLNDWFTNLGFNSFTVAGGGIEDGDIISLLFTMNLGQDIGGGWGNPDTSLQSLVFSQGTPFPAFSPDVKEYKLMLSGESANLLVTPTAANKNYLVKSFLNKYNSDAAYYKRTQTMPVKVGDTIYIGVGEKGWPSMNSNAGYEISYEGSKYIIEVVSNSSADAVTEMINNLKSVTYGNYKSQKAAIESARAAYDALSKDVKAKISDDTLKKLTEAEEQIKFYTEIDDAKTKLNALTSTSSSSQVQAALAAYNKLSDEQKEYITKADVEKFNELAEKYNMSTIAGVEQMPESEVVTTGKTGSAVTESPTEVTVSGTTATASVKKENVEAILKQAKENKSAEIVLNVAASDTKGAETVKIQLDTATVKSVVADTSASVTIKTENGQVSLDREALTTIASEAKGTTITLEVIKVTNPTEVQKKAAGTNGQVLQLIVKSGNKVISDFNKGKATVTVEIPANLQDKKVAAIYIADDGQIEQMSGKTVKIDGKDYYTFETPHFSAFALVDTDELGLEVNDEEANIEKIKELVSDMNLKARSSKTSKKNIKVTLTVDKSTSAAIKEIKSMGYTVKYKYYRSTKKASKYQARITKTTKSFTNTAGKKGTKYYYKARIQVYDKDGNLVAQTLLKQCKYAARKWTK